MNKNTVDFLALVALNGCLAASRGDRKAQGEAADILVLYSDELRRLFRFV